jgi:plastocyanin
MKKLIALVVLALVAAPVAMAASHQAKSRCTNKHYAKKHKKQCRKKKKPAQRPPTPAPTPTTPVSQYPNNPIPPAPAPAPAPPPAPTSRLGVTAREFSLTLSRTTLSSGDAIIQLQNFGQDPHNLRVERVDGSGTPADFPLTQPSTQQSETVTLGPGTYKLYCTLPGHDAAGMHATLTVVP